MKINYYEDRDAWLEDRKNRITGSKLDGIYSPKIASKTDIMAQLEKHNVDFKKSATIPQLEVLLPAGARQELFDTAPKKKGVYQLIADRVSLPPDESEDPRERGHRLEAEALAELSKELDIDFKGDLVMWIDEENPHIAFSPDGYTEDLTIAAEIKCRDSANHVQSIIENKVPDEYEKQVLQAFIVNDKLQTLYFTFYSDLIPAYPLHIVTVKREDLAEQIADIREYEVAIMSWVDNWVERLVL